MSTGCNSKLNSYNRYHSINVSTGCNSKLNSYNRYHSINVSTGCNSMLNSYNRYHSINVSTGCNSKLNSYNRYHRYISISVTISVCMGGYFINSTPASDNYVKQLSFWLT